MNQQFVIHLDTIQKYTSLSMRICEELSIVNGEILSAVDTENWLASHNCIEEISPETHLSCLVFRSEEDMIAFMLRYM